VCPWKYPKLRITASIHVRYFIMLQVFFNTMAGMMSKIVTDFS
jgi:hypothetical protein